MLTPMITPRMNPRLTPRNEATKPFQEALPEAPTIPSGTTSWVIFVDDELRLLDSYRRCLCDQFRIRTATSAAEALELMAELGPPAVLVADYQMPGMNGIDLLIRCRELAPDTVRIMLTGQGDLPMAIRAVNQGQVFRFLAKPVQEGVVRQAVDEAMIQHAQLIDQRGLLNEALTADEGAGPEPSALGQLLEARLTRRELDVLRLIGDGASSKEIAPRLGISHRTVDVHRSHILAKLNLHNSVSLVKVALMAGLI